MIMPRRNDPLLLPVSPLFVWATLAVATVQTVDRKVDSGFARITLKPAASPDGVRHVLILEPTGVQLPPRPIEAAASEPASTKASKKGTRPAAGRPGAQP